MCARTAGADTREQHSESLRVLTAPQALEVVVPALLQAAFARPSPGLSLWAVTLRLCPGLVPASLALVWLLRPGPTAVWRRWPAGLVELVLLTAGDLDPQGSLSGDSSGCL